MSKKRFRVESLDSCNQGLFKGIEEVRVTFSEGYGKDGQASTHIYRRDGQYVWEVFGNRDNQRLSEGDITDFSSWDLTVLLKPSGDFVTQMRQIVKNHCDLKDAKK